MPASPAPDTALNTQWHRRHRLFAPERSEADPVRANFRPWPLREPHPNGSRGVHRGSGPHPTRPSTGRPRRRSVRHHRRVRSPGSGRLRADYRSPRSVRWKASRFIPARSSGVSPPTATGSGSNTTLVNPARGPLSTETSSPSLALLTRQPSPRAPARIHRGFIAPR